MEKVVKWTVLWGDSRIINIKGFDSEDAMKTFVVDLRTGNRRIPLNEIYVFAGPRRRITLSSTVVLYPPEES